MFLKHVSTIEEITQLLCISVTNEREKKIAKSFEKLLKSFEVMNTVSADDENTCIAHDDESHSNGVLRDDIAKSYANTQSLIDLSEEHEAEYIVIPNVL